MIVRLEVPEVSAGRRLDVVVAEAAHVSRTKARALVADGDVRIDGRVERKSYRVSPGELVEIEVVEQPVPEPPTGIQVVYEDEHLLVVDKPAGVVVHRAPGSREGTMVDALEAAGHALAQQAGADRPGIVHRLDRDVSGLLVVAKTDDAYGELARAMRGREIEREYLALVHGQPSTDRGKIDAPIGRNPRHRTRMATLPEGRSAVTWFRVLERFSGTALLEVQLETGRTHQIRTHLASIGHPIVGDAAYGRDPTTARGLGLDRPFLHARRLAFVHPVSGVPFEVRSDPPSELTAALDRLRG